MANKIQSISDLFEHELKDIYDAEKKLVEALKKLTLEATDPQVKQAFESHRMETVKHAERVEKVFEMLNKEASRGEGCAGIDGLLEEKKSFSEHEPTREILQVFNLAAAQKTERYEITAYEGLIQLAKHLQLDEAARMLEMNLDEEKAALQKLQAFANAPPTPSSAGGSKQEPRVR